MRQALLISATPATAPCLDARVVLAFIDGTLPLPARAGVEAHLASCGACAEVTTWAAADIAGAGRVPGREGHPFIGQLGPGSMLGRYQILGALGSGGMGEVYAAYHPDLDRRIALKVVHESGADSAERRARLLREARAIARLSHPNVVAVHDAGIVGDQVFVAMELLDGETVDVWMRAGKRSWRQILDVFVEAGRGLAAVHAADIVHRDFKPQNVMIGRDGSVRVMDFGLARLAGDGDVLAPAVAHQGTVARAAWLAPTVTRAGALLGTPAYMAPEQLRGEPADARADQFSFCVALHEALYGGRRPATRSPARARPRARGGKPRARSATAVALRNAVLRGLDPEPGRRFDSMDRLLAALTRGIAGARRPCACGVRHGHPGAAKELHR